MIPLHKKYNSIVRQVAKDRGALVIDLESKLDELDKRSLFLDDHIHLSQQGRAFAAQQIFLSLQQSGVLVPGDE